MFRSSRSKDILIVAPYIKQNYIDHPEPDGHRDVIYGQKPDLRQTITVVRF